MGDLVPLRQALQPSTLLDANGRPLGSPPTARRVVRGNPRGIETYNTHPVIGMDTEALLSYYRSAEYGNPLRQFDAFDDLIERDGDLRGMLNSRNESVSNCEWCLSPPPGRDDKPSRIAAAALEERLQSRIQFREFIAHQLSCVPFGFAATNMMWDYDQGVVVPVDFVNPAQRRFAAPGRDRADEIWLINGESGALDLIALERGLWAVSRYRGRNPWAAGLMRTCAWWTMFKLTGFRDYRVFADMFGLPLVIGYYEEGAGKESRDKLAAAAQSIGQDGYAVLSSLTDLVIKETARGGDSSTVWPQIIKICDAQNTKLITGGTLNTDVAGVGSYNAASVHEARGFEMKQMDARRVEEMFVRDIGVPFVAWNGYDRAAPPRLVMKLTRADLNWAQTLEIIGQVIGLDEAQMREQFGLRAPADGQGVKFQPTKAPEPQDPARAKEKKPQ